MQTFFFVALAIAAAIFGSSEAANAQSAKSAVKVANTIRIPSTSGQDWTPILTAAIKTSKLKDLLFNVSLECGLFTRTTGRSRGGAAAVAEAQAGVKVRVVVNPDTANERVAEPQPVGGAEGISLCKRTQRLTVQLAGTLGACVDGSDGSVPDGIIQIPEECALTDDEVQVLLDTMNASSFSFVLTNAGVGTQTVEVQAKIDTSVSGNVVAEALVGLGTLSVEEVRLVKGDGSEVIEP